MPLPKKSASDPEITAISVVHGALKDLDSGAQKRVLDYVAGKLGLPAVGSLDQHEKPVPQEPTPNPVESPVRETKTEEESEGISPVALKWMRRSGLAASSLSSLFSLGVDEIDLVAKTVPGAGKKQRMHSVLLLKGIAAYLSTGLARVSHEQIKEACLHYDAFDTTNFASYLRSFASEVSGTKESGYTLTARGLTTATEMIKGVIKGSDLSK